MAGTTKTEEPVIKAATTTPVIAVAPKKKVIKIVHTAGGDCTKYADLISQYNWPIATAMQICRDESQGDPSAINWDDKHYDSKGNLICVSSQGLFQVACSWPASLGYTKADLLDPAKNIAMAYDIWSSRGFYPWSTYKGE